MSRKFRVFGMPATLVLGLLGAVFVPPASATVLACGANVTVSTTLTADVGPCPLEGLHIDADNITLDLNGHKVFGQADPGQGAGIVFRGVTGSTVKNGEVTAFDAGVAILEGGGNTVRSMNVHDNIGPSDGDFGDGITIQGPSNNNLITGNQVVHNGPYDGIGMFGNTDNNVISNNSVRNNNVLGTHHGADPAMQDTGIRLENGSDGNTVTGNSVSGNGLDGIEIFSNSDNNIVKGNQVTGNGFNNNPAGGLRVGDGINAFSGANGNVIQNNQSTLNAGSGIRLYSNATSNFITTNFAFGNNAQPNAISTGYDLKDDNANCDSNAWHGNFGVIASPLCVLTP